MIRIIFDIFSVLLPKERKKILLYQILLIFMSFLEIASVYSIAPFVGLVSKQLNIENVALFQNMANIFGIYDNTKFIVFFGFIVFFIYLIGILFSIVTTFLVTRFSNLISQRLSTRFYERILKKDLIDFLEKNSSKITSEIAFDCERVNSLIWRMMLVNFFFIKSLIIIISLLFYNFKVTATIILLLLICYLGIFIFFKK